MYHPYLYMIKIKILLALNYRYEVLFSLISKLLLLCASVFFWKAAYHNLNTVSAVNENQMIVYSVFSIILSSLFSMSVEGNIRSRVRKGNIAVDYIKPIEIFKMYFCEDLGNSVTAFLQTVIPVLAVSALFIVKPLPASPLNFLLFLISACFSYGILWLMSAMFGLLYFWFIDIGPLGSIKDYIILILSGSFIPVWLYPQQIQSVLKFLPFIYTYQHPLSIYIGKISLTQALYGMLIQVIWIFAFLLLFSFLKNKVEKNILVQGG
ncbi:MAG: ABC-2 family transporter protein [Oscillospiraceae bacterium]|nr:ABC-2 family transporter protein [Oscillospiraceae bacterium]